MATEVWLQARPKGRPARWSFRATVGGAVAFDSSWVAIRSATEEDAAWLAGVIDSLAARGLSPGRPGLPFPGLGRVEWIGYLDDDCSATLGDMRAHAEHLHGPRRGGAWYCSVVRSGRRLFHTADCGIQPRGGAAARWLCELIMAAGRSGGDA